MLQGIGPSTNLIASPGQHKPGEIEESDASRSRADALVLPPDEVELSAEGVRKAQEDSASRDRPEASAGNHAADEEPQDSAALSDEEKEQVRELEARDREVRQHEHAHQQAAGQLAVGGPSYEYEQGPDGNQYAVGGEVKIRLEEGNSPEETQRLARQAKSAAMAPAEPSSQDAAVAREATAMEREATQELRESRDEESAREPPRAHGQLRAYSATTTQLEVPSLLTDLMA